MTTQKRAVAVIAFAMTFMFIGWVSPILFATYAPPNMIIEEHSFAAQNATTDASKHYVCFDRTVHRAAAGQAFVELYIISETDDDIERTEIASITKDRYYQQGRSEVITPLALPNNISEGKYRYLLVLKMELADGRVERPFTFKSDPFYINDSVDMASKPRNVECG